jgi:hypothetical protein
LSTTPLTITIQGTPVLFPSAGSSPQWAEAVDEFATLVEEALNTVIGAFDVAPQALIIDSYNPGTNIPIAALSFPTASVRSAFIRYAVFRSTNLTSVGETGTLTIFYNPNGPTGNKWDVAQILSGPGGDITFYVTDTGQVEFSTTAIAGTGHTGKLTFTAQAILQS